MRAMSDLRVMITGGTGFIGSHTAAALIEAGHEVRLLARDREKVARVYGEWNLPVPECVVGDITDSDQVALALSGCNAAVHAAALVALEAGNAGLVRRSNLAGVECVMGQVRELESVLYVSSAAALFEPGRERLHADLPVASPRTPYGRSKADAECYVRRLQDDGARIATTYPAAVLGPDDPGLSESNHALRSMARDLFIATSTGFQMIDVRDLARIHVGLLERARGPGRYMTPGRFLPWSELGDLLDDLIGGALRRVRLPGAALRLAGRVCDVVKRVVDFDFPVTLESMTFASRWPVAEPSPELGELGVELREPRETLVDALRWLVRAGHLLPEHIGPLHEA